MAFIEKFLQVWMGVARRCSWLAVIAFLAGAYFAANYAFSTLTINTDTGDMLDAGLDFQERAEVLNDAFPDSKYGLTVIVRAAVADEADAFARRLAEELEPDTENFVRVFSPTSDKFFAQNALLYLDDAELESRLAKLSKATGLIEALAAAPTAETLFEKLTEYDEPVRQSELGADTLRAVYAELAKVVDAENNGRFRPFSWERILEDDARERQSHLRYVEILPTLDLNKVEPAKTSIEAAGRAIKVLNEEFDGRVDGYITGGPALRGEELRSVIRGIGVSLILSVFFVSALLYFAYRSVFLTVLSLLSLGITIIYTSAFAALAVGELNLISIAFTVLLVGLGLDFAIHLLLHVEERRADGQSTKVALEGSVHEVGPALAIAAPTTALAFFSFLPTSFSGIGDLGLIAGGGVIIAFFVSITFLPAAVAALPRLQARETSGNVRRLFGGLDKVAIPIAVLTIGLAAYSLRTIPAVELESDPMSLRDPGSPSVRGYNLLFDAEENAPFVLTRLVATPDAARETASIAAKLDVVREVRSLPKLIPDNQDDKLELIDFAAAPLLFALEAHERAATTSIDTQGAARNFLDQLSSGDDDATRQQLRNALSSLLADSGAEKLENLDRALFRYWPDFLKRIGDGFNADFIDDDALPVVLKEKYKSANGFYRVDFLPAGDVRSDAQLNRFIADVETAFPDIAGGIFQATKAGKEVEKAMFQATGLALLVVLIVLSLLIRQAKLVFFIMFPLLIAMVLTLAVGDYLQVPLNMANVIVLPLLIGIGVDSGIHLVLRQKQVAAGEDVYGTSTSRAVLFSALTTVASFGSLIILSHRGLSSLGALLTIAIGATLVCMLVVLPALLKLAPINAGNGRDA